MDFIIYNILAVIVSFSASILLFVLAAKSKLLRTGLALMAGGIIVGLGFHSILELVEVMDYLDISFLVKIMPILVSTGSVMILAGGIHFLYNVTNPIKEITGIVPDLESGKAAAGKKEKLSAINNEIGILFSAVVSATEQLIESKKELAGYSNLLEEKVASRTKDLEEKIEELKSVTSAVVGRENRMIELKKEINSAYKEIGRPEPFDLSFLDE